MYYIEYDQHILTWEQHSEGQEIFVFLYGHGGVRQLWVPFIQKFFHLGRWITLDLPGHYPSRTSHNYRTLSQDQLIELETKAIKDICGDQGITLIGHSTGALVAFGIADRLSQQVKRIVSISGLVWGPPGGILGTGLWFLNHGLYPLFWMFGQLVKLSPWTMAFMISLYTQEQRGFLRNHDFIQTCHAAYAWTSKQSWANLAIVLKTIGKSDIRPIARRLSMPVLAVAGEKDTIVSPDQTNWLAENLPDVTSAIIPGVGHMLNFEAPHQLECLMIEWLKHSNRLHF